MGTESSSEQPSTLGVSDPEPLSFDSAREGSRIRWSTTGPIPIQPRVKANATQDPMNVMLTQDMARWVDRFASYCSFGYTPAHFDDEYGNPHSPKLMRWAESLECSSDDENLSHLRQQLEALRINRALCEARNQNEPHMWCLNCVRAAVWPNQFGGQGLCGCVPLPDCSTIMELVGQQPNPYLKDSIGWLCPHFYAPELFADGHGYCARDQTQESKEKEWPCIRCAVMGIHCVKLDVLACNDSWKAAFSLADGQLAALIDIVRPLAQDFQRKAEFVPALCTMRLKLQAIGLLGTAAHVIDPSIRRGSKLSSLVPGPLPFSGYDPNAYLSEAPLDIKDTYLVGCTVSDAEGFLARAHNLLNIGPQLTDVGKLHASLQSEFRTCADGRLWTAALGVYYLKMAERFGNFAQALGVRPASQWCVSCAFLECLESEPVIFCPPDAKTERKKKSYTWKQVNSGSGSLRFGCRHIEARGPGARLQQCRVLAEVGPRDKVLIKDLPPDHTTRCERAVVHAEAKFQSLDPSFQPNLSEYLALVRDATQWKDEASRQQVFQRLTDIRQAMLQSLILGAGNPGYPPLEWLSDNGKDRTQVRKWLGGPYWIGAMRRAIEEGKALDKILEWFIHAA